MQVGVHPIRATVRQQGRTLAWLARQVRNPNTGRAMSLNYLHRALKDPSDPESRPAPDWLYVESARVLGVPEHLLRPTGADETRAVA